MPKLVDPTPRQRWITADRRTVRRNGVAAIVVVGIITTGGYAVSQALLPGPSEPTPVVSTSVTARTPGDAELARIREGLAAQYGQASSAELVPRGRAMREMRRAVAGEYGQAPSRSGVVPTGRAMREMQRAVAGEYGQAPSASGVVPTGRAMREMQRAVAGEYAQAPPAHDAVPAGRAMGEMRDAVAGQYGGR